MKLVVGLGNPGRQYADTRHNVGFDVVNELARRWQIDMTRQRFGGVFGDGSVANCRAGLLEPLTYMNRSGQSVREAATFYKLELDDIIVIVDDLALPLGRLRIRKNGSAGGHNGLADVIQKMGDDAFARLRIGIGAVGGERMVSHVLGKFTADERDVVDGSITRAATAVERWLEQDIDAVMNDFNRPEQAT